MAVPEPKSPPNPPSDDLRDPSVNAPSRSPGALGELARLFTRLGFTAFGGPAVHVAIMQEEVVERRHWMSRQQFLDILGATNLIPGPNSTEMALHIGLMRGGYPGMFLVGLCFIGPALLLTLLLAAVYVSLGTLPAAEPVLLGLKPAVIAVIALAVWRLGAPLFRKDARLAIIGSAVMAASVYGVGELTALLAGGFLGMSWLRISHARSQGASMLGPGLFMGWWAQTSARAQAFLAQGPTIGPMLTAPPPEPWRLLWPVTQFFLEVGAVLYGGGYVLVAVVQGRLVDDLGWLTQQQLMDAIAAGQITPGPVFSTASFIGYVIGAAQPGASVAHAVVYGLLAGVAIFLPAFVFVPVLHAILPRVRAWTWTGLFLDSINASAVALMAAVVLTLGQSHLLTHTPAGVGIEYIAATIFVVTLAAGYYWKNLHAGWILLIGAVMGMALSALPGVR